MQEYEKGHIPGFRWFPGGQVVQRSDDVLVVKHCPVVFACDGKARATVVASWYRQFGFEDVYAVQGGTTAWAAAGLPLSRESEEPAPVGLAQAREHVQSLSLRPCRRLSPR